MRQRMERRGPTETGAARFGCNEQCRVSERRFEGLPDDNSRLCAAKTAGRVEPCGIGKRCFGSSLETLDYSDMFIKLQMERLIEVRSPTVPRRLAGTLIHLANSCESEERCVWSRRSLESAD